MKKFNLDSTLREIMEEQKAFGCNSSTLALLDGEEIQARIFIIQEGVVARGIETTLLRLASMNDQNKILNNHLTH
jgi:sulfur transfer complex TusBCD TusB component (DsrH family)